MHGQPRGSQWDEQASGLRHAMHSIDPAPVEVKVAASSGASRQACGPVDCGARRMREPDISWLERELDADTRRSRESRMRVEVLHTVRALTRQARRVEVVYVGDLRVEEIERFQHETGPIR